MQNIFGNFWKWVGDRDGDGDTDVTDLVLAAWKFVLVYGVGTVLLVTTWTRSYHLLSSPVMNPGVFTWWPYLTALAPEVGFVTAVLATSLGFRRGNLPLIVNGILGLLAFMIVIGTLQIYDVNLVEGNDLTRAGQWAQFIASVISLITIVYLAVTEILLSAMAGAAKFGRVIPGKFTGYTKRSEPKRERRPFPEEGEFPELTRPPIPPMRIPVPAPIEDRMGAMRQAVRDQAVRDQAVRNVDSDLRVGGRPIGSPTSSPTSSPTKGNGKTNDGRDDTPFIPPTLRNTD